MTALIPSQIKDAVAFIEALQQVIESLPDDPEWGGGMRLNLPAVIPLTPDYKGEAPVAWLVANDFNGYDLTTQEPDRGYL